MKYIKENEIKIYPNSTEAVELVELDKRQRTPERVISFEKTKENVILISEQCDTCFFVEYTKQAAIEMLQEIIEWIGEAK